MSSSLYYFAGKGDTTEFFLQKEETYFPSLSLLTLLTFQKSKCGSDFFFLPKCKKHVIYVFKSFGESFTYSFRSNIVASHNHIQSTVRPTQQSLYKGTNEQPSSEINTALNATGHDVTKPPLKVACLEARASFIIETIL